MLKDYEVDYILSVGTKHFVNNPTVSVNGGRVSVIAEVENPITEPDYEYGDWKKWIIRMPDLDTEPIDYVVARDSHTADMFAREKWFGSRHPDTVRYVPISRAQEKLRGIGNSGRPTRIFIESVHEFRTRREEDEYQEARLMAKRGFFTDRVLEVKIFTLPAVEQEDFN